MIAWLFALVLLAACAPNAVRSPDRVLRKRSNHYTLINPILDIEPTVEFHELRPFKHQVQALIKKLIEEKKVRQVSVYYRDLNNGPVLGIDWNERFAPASLAKVPLLIACLDQAQDDPGFLARRVRYEGMQEFQTVTELEPVSSLEEGKEYTVEQLLEAMISHSDNGATVALAKVADGRNLNEVFTDLGLIVPDVRTPQDYMTVKEYATFFRMLYNASYLSRAMSQKALLMMTKSDFKLGLRAGVPAGVVVANKFGERIATEVGGLHQVHECGVVYHPTDPYLLCVMTRGESEVPLAYVISDISRVVYQNVTRGRVSSTNR